MPPNMHPIIVCGKSPSIAKLVRKFLLPEYDGTPLSPYHQQRSE
jgi:hypothetical protein